MPKIAIIASLVWQWTPFMMLILLAGLQSQPGEPLEAAKVDGASAWQTFRYLTLPAHAQLPRAGDPAGRDLHRAELRRRVHHHLGRAGHRQPALRRLPDVLHRPRIRPGLRRRRRRRHRLDHHRDVRAARRLHPVQRGGEPDMAATTAEPVDEPPPVAPARHPVAQPFPLCLGGRAGGVGDRAAVRRPGALDGPDLAALGGRRRDQPAVDRRRADPRAATASSSTPIRGPR